MPDNFAPDDTTYQYKWYHNGELLPDVNGIEVEVFDEGLYKVVVSVNGCEALREVEATYEVFEIEIIAGCNNSRFMLATSNLDEQEASVTWTGPDGYFHTGSEADIAGMQPGEYFVTVDNNRGYIAESSVLVENTLCSVPRGISPNNNELNDKFDLSHLNVKEIIIFNRFGLEVYRKKDYISEWHGQSDKGELPTGTYYYILTVHGGKSLTGWVYLQREN